MKRFAVIALLLASIQGFSQESAPQDPYVFVPKAQTTLKTEPEKKYTAGDVLEIEVLLPAGTDQVVPKMAEDLKKGPVEHGTGRILWWKPAQEGGDHVTIGVTTYTPGPFEVKPIPFMKAGETDAKAKPVFVTDTVTATFSSVASEKIKDDIYGPESVGFPLWLKILISVIAATALGFAIHYWLKWYRARRERLNLTLSEARKLTPIEEFILTREKIDAKKYISKAQFKPHYYGLSEAAKRFLGKAFHFNAEDKTTRELVTGLSEAGMAQHHIERWITLFEEMDVIKFTDQKPAEDVAEKISDRCAELAQSAWKGSPAYLEWREKQRLQEVKK